ncbi:MAG: glycosyl hydrolase family 18 protein [Bacteroidota bacterium]
MKKHYIIIALTFIITICKAQIPNPALIGYWHNWTDINAPYIQLDSIDNRYNVIEIAFAVPTSPSDMNMLFTPDVVSPSVFITKVQTLQSQGKKVLLSIGGATTSIDLTTTINKNAFVSTMTAIINTYGFDGIDIDIENGNSILISGGTIAAPASIAQLNLIDAIKQIMANYYTSHSHKLLLTMAPETAYVQGGQSAFGSIWGGYLPIIDALRDSLDVLQVQLYNSGSMYGIDGIVYTQGTADFIIAMTEAVIHGFNTAGGMFVGLPANKVAVGLPACTSAAGGGFVDSATVKAAIDYLRGNGTQPGTYILSNIGGYPSLRGMMTWSINWDAVSNCASVYQYANNYENIFGVTTSISHPISASSLTIYPNPTSGQFTILLPTDYAIISVTDILGQMILKTQTTEKTLNLELDNNGVYIIYVKTKQGTTTRKLIVNR